MSTGNVTREAAYKSYGSVQRRLHGRDSGTALNVRNRGSCIHINGGGPLNRQLTLGIVAILALTALTGCSSQNIALPVRDISPSHLDVVLALAPIYAQPGFGDLAVHADFFLSQHTPLDTPVLFSGNETMTCNGQALTRANPTELAMGENPAFTGQISSDKVGKGVSCLFTSSGAQIPLTYTYPGSIDNILAPRAGAKVKRSARVAIAYKSSIKANANTTVSIMADVINLDDNHIPFYEGGGSQVRSAAQAETGTCYIDLSHANTGNSVVVLLDEVTTRLATSQFHSLTITYIDTNEIEPPGKPDSLDYHIVII